MARTSAWLSASSRHTASVSASASAQSSSHGGSGGRSSGPGTLVPADDVFLDHAALEGMADSRGAAPAVVSLRVLLWDGRPSKALAAMPVQLSRLGCSCCSECRADRRCSLGHLVIGLFALPPASCSRSARSPPGHSGLRSLRPRRPLRRPVPRRGQQGARPAWRRGSQGRDPGVLFRRSRPPPGGGAPGLGRRVAVPGARVRS